MCDIPSTDIRQRRGGPCPLLPTVSYLWCTTIAPLRFAVVRHLAVTTGDTVIISLPAVVGWPSWTQLKLLDYPKRLHIPRGSHLTLVTLMVNSLVSAAWDLVSCSLTVDHQTAMVPIGSFGSPVRPRVGVATWSRFQGWHEAQQVPCNPKE